MTNHFTMSVAVALLFLAGGLSLPASPLAAQSRVFRLETNEFWLNLHHFLYVLGRHEAGERDARREAVVDAPADEAGGMTRLDQAEQVEWRRAVQWYARGLSRRDAVFSRELPVLVGALAGAGDAPSLAGVPLDTAVARVLTDAAPIYRKAWWNEHRAANEEWLAKIEPLVQRHGQTMLEFVTNAYGLGWPRDGYPIHVSSYANWAGAYSTRGNLLVIASRYEGMQANYGLETLFHESMHQWDEAVQDRLNHHAKESGVPVSPDLSHVMIFLTAGEAVQRVLPDHVPFADANGVYNRRWRALRQAVAEAWKPWLDGRGSREEALRALVRRAGSERSPARSD